MPRVNLSQLVELSACILEKLGVSAADAQAVAETIEYANGHGVPTHGAGRLPLYEKNINSGSINPAAVPEVVIDNAAIGVVDGHDALGQVAAKTAMELALSKVREFGVAVVAVRNSNNFGTAGFYGAWAAREGCGAIIMANASPAMAPTGGTKALLGTNPLCMALPGTDEKPPVVLDMATTVVARTKIRSAAKEGQEIPAHWALNAQGQPTTDPQEALGGTLQPVGGYKGYGLSLFVDLFAGMLAQGAFAGNVVPLSEVQTPSRNGHFFMLFDVSRFMDAQQYAALFDQMADAVAQSGQGVRLPGQRGFAEARENGGMVTIPKKQFEEINDLAQRVGAGSLEEVR